MAKCGFAADQASKTITREQLVASLDGNKLEQYQRLNKFYTDQYNNLNTLAVKYKNLNTMIRQYNSWQASSVKSEDRNLVMDDPEFQAKLEEMEKKYPGKGFSKQKVYNTIKGESAFDTGARNKDTNASGLFQFTQPALDDINKKFGTNHTLQGVRGMSATEQLGVYDQYLERGDYSGGNELGGMYFTSIFLVDLTFT